MTLASTKSRASTTASASNLPSADRRSSNAYRRSTIWVDEREPAGTVQALRNLGLDASMTRLDSGDYLFYSRGRRVLVERKTVSNLLGSLKGQLSEQAQRMLKDADVSVLLVVGEFRRDPDGYLSFRTNGMWMKSGWLYASVMSILIELQLAGLIVVYWAPVSDYAKALLQLMSAFDREEFAFLRMRQRPEPTYSDAVWALCALPGLGPRSAAALLEEFGSLYAVACASVEDLASVKINGRRLGTARARRLWEAWRATNGGSNGNNFRES